MARYYLTNTPKERAMNRLYKLIRLECILAFTRKELALKESVAPPHREFDNERDKYSQFSQEGVPTHDKNGLPLKGRALLRVQTKYNAQKEGYERAKEDIQILRQEIKDLERSIQDLERELKRA